MGKSTKRGILPTNAGRKYDGIDSNGKLWVNGGIVIASGSATPEEGLDCNNSQNFIVTGGTLIGTGGAAISTSTSSTQRSVIYNSVSAKTGETYTVYSGGSLSGNIVNWNGWFEDGTYTAGTELGNFTSNSLTTTVGQINGPDGGPGNGGPGNGGWVPGWWN